MRYKPGDKVVAIENAQPLTEGTIYTVFSDDENAFGVLLEEINTWYISKKYLAPAAPYLAKKEFDEKFEDWLKS